MGAATVPSCPVKGRGAFRQSAVMRSCSSAVTAPASVTRNDPANRPDDGTGAPLADA